MRRPPRRRPAPQDTSPLSHRANPGGATLAGTTTEAPVAGVATFSDLSLNEAGSDYTLVASATGLPSATSAECDIQDDVPTAGASSDTTLENTKLVVAAPGVLVKDKSPAAWHTSLHPGRLGRRGWGPPAVDVRSDEGRSAHGAAR